MLSKKIKMDKFPTRKPIRLKKYDYSTTGYYYVTICADNREEIFGNICRGTISCALNDGGAAAKKYWEEIPQYYSCVHLDAYVVMPNHIHGILIIDHKRVQNIEPLQNKYQHLIPSSLGSIIRGYKIGVTKWFRQNTNIEKVWQRSFYDHIIRNDKSLDEIREYISNNPLKWDDDENNIKNNKLMGQACLTPTE